MNKIKTNPSQFIKPGYKFVLIVALLLAGQIIAQQKFTIYQTNGTNKQFPVQGLKITFDHNGSFSCWRNGLKQDMLFSTVDKIYFTSLSLPVMTTQDIKVNVGWNIISVPVVVQDMSPASLFTGITSPAYEYVNRYNLASTLTVGKGFWLKFANAATFPITGTPVMTKEDTVKVGWNIIGAFDTDVAISSLNTVPSGILGSLFFEYNNGYMATATLMKGKGYWIKAKQDGVINIAGAAQKTNSGILAEFSKINSTWYKLTISDAVKNASTLYLGSGIKETDKYDLPPAPPSGIFDVRWSTDRLVESISRINEIKINSAEYPVTIKVDGCDLRIKDKINGNIVNQVIKNGETLTLTNKFIERFEITGAAVPTKFELFQNYPNPFNPTTKIKYSISEKAITKMTIFNVLGQKTEELINEEQEAGYYEIEWNGSKLTSGVYLVQLISAENQSIKKIILMK